MSAPNSSSSPAVPSSESKPLHILLLGYGKMGREIEKIALERGHTVAGRIDEANRSELDELPLKSVDVAIEFSSPEAAAGNVRWCLERGIPVVSGTTGWLDQKPALDELCRERGGAFFYASNYSIGVNLFFKLNRYLARLLQNYPEYALAIEEIHHVAKKDAPSGTALTLAQGLLAELPRLTGWVPGQSAATDQLPVHSVREGDVPGTHIIRAESAVDTLEIRHLAHSRQGFALGAVRAAEWLANRRGVFGMEDLLGETD